MGYFTYRFTIFSFYNFEILFLKVHPKLDGAFLA